MDKQAYLEAIKQSLQETIWKEEFELGFLNDELGKLEDDINKTSTIIYPSVKDGRKDQGRLQQEKTALLAIVRQHENVLETLKAKLTFLENSF